MGLMISACAPVPVTRERAQALCLGEVRDADGVSGYAGVGIGSSGGRAKGGIRVTNRVFNPQTEEEFLADCVARRLEGRPAPTQFGITLGGEI